MWLCEWPCMLDVERAALWFCFLVLRCGVVVVSVGAASFHSAVVMNIVASLSAISLFFLLTEISPFHLLSHNLLFLLLLLPRPLLIAPSPPILLLEPLFARHPHSSVPPHHLPSSSGGLHGQLHPVQHPIPGRRPQVPPQVPIALPLHGQ